MSADWGFRFRSSTWCELARYYQEVVGYSRELAEGQATLAEYLFVVQGTIDLRDIDPATGAPR